MSELWPKPFENFTSLSPWMSGRTSATPFWGEEASAVSFEEMGFVAIDRVRPLHEAGKLKAENLARAWKTTRQYLYDACEIVSGGDDGPPLLDKEEIHMIVEALGPPPEPCYPLYFISVRDRASGTEELMYIGKTSSSSNRFAGGHAAFTRLHDPAFDGFEKLIHAGTVMLIDGNGEYLPLEAVRPLPMAEALLLAIESQLIFELRPKFNNHGMRQNLSRAPIDIHIQNTSSRFLNDTMVHRSDELGPITWTAEGGFVRVAPTSIP